MGSMGYSHLQSGLALGIFKRGKSQTMLLLGKNYDDLKGSYQITTVYALSKPRGSIFQNGFFGGIQI